MSPWAVVKAYVGLATEDTTGGEFKFGSLVRPGHRGIWQEPLRTGKYAINPRCYAAEKAAQEKRLDLEAARGRADMQSDLARSAVGVDIARNRASGVQAEADGESYRLEKVGRAGAVKTEAEGLAIAKGLEAQQLAIDKDQTALVNVVRELASGAQRFMPENLALNLGEGGLGASLSALTPLLMRRLGGGRPTASAPAAPVAPAARRAVNGSGEAAKTAEA